MPCRFGHTRNLLRRWQHFLKCGHGGVATLLKKSVFIKHIGYAATHACCKVTAGLAKYNNRSACHVLASMVTRALYNRN